MRSVAFAGLLLLVACVPPGAERVKSFDEPARDAGIPMADAGPSIPPPPRDGGVAPRDGGVIPRDGGDLCLEQPTKPPPSQAVYYGTARPTHVPLSDGQQLAVGTFGGCSGLLITPTWVLTAAHCGLSSRAQFCIGVVPDDPRICIRAARVVNNPSADMTLVELQRDARDLAPTVEPVPLFTDTLDDSWIGTTAEASGYGQQETGASGEREFTAEPIVEVRGNFVTIDGQGQRGVCFGDSGGPLFVIAADGTPRVIGDLSNGDGNCVGRDNYTRVDRHRGWIEGYTGPTIDPGPTPCEDVDAEGSCDPAYTVATYCEDDALQVVECADTCGWSASDAGWRCLDIASDPCGGVTPLGRCEGAFLGWCERGVPMIRDCGACDEVCVESADPLLGAECAPRE